MKSLLEVYESINSSDEDVLNKNKLDTIYIDIAKAMVEVLEISPNVKHGNDPTKVNYITPLYLAVKGKDEISEIDNLVDFFLKRNPKFKKELKNQGVTVRIEKTNRGYTPEGWSDVTWSYNLHYDKTYLGSIHLKLAKRPGEPYKYAELQIFPAQDYERNDIYNAMYDFAGVKH